jgi:hypothetical protein
MYIGALMILDGLLMIQNNFQLLLRVCFNFPKFYPIKERYYHYVITFI